jgi:uncharacterized membrane protein/DNA-directed RNA polymerase subunit M/transcription elongation factor TFIIS
VTIEFHCPHCDKLLKTPDDKAGVRANCPGCGQTVTVPDASLETGHADESFSVGPASGGAAASSDDAESNAEISSVEDTKLCPMCGALIKQAALRCRFCGEFFTHQSTNVPTRIDAGDVISRSWTIFKQQLGLLLGVFLIQIAIGMVLAIGIYAALGVVAFSMMGQGGMAPPNPAQLAAAVNIVALIVTPLGIAVNSYFDAGIHIILLKVARGQSAEVGELFSGGRFYWRVFLANMMFTLPSMLGNLADVWIETGGSIIGGIVQLVLLLLFWPCVYVIVDRDAGVTQAFSAARTLASMNYGPTILLGLVFVLLSFVGVVACCVGWIFTFPLAMLMFGVAYCAMSGQAVAGSPNP